MLSLNPPLRTTPQAASQPSTGWTLTGCLSAGSSTVTVPLVHLPFAVGRDPACDLPIPSRNVSKRHAEILHTMGTVLVRDLQSTNGTFVNGHRINAPTPVGEGDLLQFADVELQLNREELAAADRTLVNNQSGQRGNISRMQEVLGQQRLKIHFQPIVAGNLEHPFGYEALVRSDVQGLESPLRLFETAESLGLEKRVSVLCREIALRTIHQAGISGVLFLNTHAHEALDDDMVAELKTLQEKYGPRQIVLEVHEEAVGDIEQFCRFKASLHAIGIRLAFDDFGVGQSRLLEIARVRPDYIKFDRSLVKDLGTPAAIHASLVASLHQHATELGISTLAEGLETPESIAACQAIGFSFYQGYAFGKPQPLT